MKLLLLLAALQPVPPELGRSYLAAVTRGDSLYARRLYPAALTAYRQANELVPSEPGALVGIGWTLLKTGAYFEAETTLSEVLMAVPDHSLARQGLELLPRPYRFKLTTAYTSELEAGLRTLAGFIEYNHRSQTTVTLGFQSTSQNADCRGLHSVLVLCRRLKYPWSARLDLFTLSEWNDPRYWKVIYAPSLAASRGVSSAGITLIGWNSLQVLELQAHLSQGFPSGFSLSLIASVNRSQNRWGWLLPLQASLRPLARLEARASFGLGSIANHVDLAVPVVYSQPQRLTRSMRAGVVVHPVAWFSLFGFVAWESYDGGETRLFPSLTVSARH